jgi:ribosomal-protein-alanine N-acetyltransferase
MDARFQIRPATDADLAAVAALERECFPDPWSEDSFRSLLAGPALVAADANTVVGYGFARYAVDVGEILNVAVAPRSRRLGIARALVEALCVQLEALGVTDVFLEVRASNAPAQALYDAQGFRPVGRRPRYYRRPVEDALLLLRRLGGPSAPAEDGRAG